MNKTLTIPNTESPSISARYERARKFLTDLPNPDTSNILNGTIFPHWIGSSDCFWYERHLHGGREFRLVKVREGSNELAFDHKALAKALESVTDEKVDSANLPVIQVKIDLDTVSFVAFETFWCYNIGMGKLTKYSPEVQISGLISPNAEQAVFVKDHNIWLRDLKTEQETALTYDGEALYAYGAPGLAWGLEWGNDKGHPQARWSPDGKKLLTLQRDTRQVKLNTKIQFVPSDGNMRPEVIQQRFAIPGDEHVGAYRLVVIDVDTAKIHEPDYPHLPMVTYGTGFFDTGLAWWSKDSRCAYFLDNQRGDQRVKLVEFDITTGLTRTLFDETSDSSFVYSPCVEGHPVFRPLPETDELIWYSECNGWPHLYLYDLKTGKLKTAITQGDWTVFEILHVDTVKRELVILACGRVKGRDPYYKEIVCVQMDSGELTPLASSDHEYYVDGVGTVGATLLSQGMSPSGEFLVTTRSRIDESAVSLVFDRKGQQVMEVEAADISALPNNWQWPEPVKMLAADGQTEIYGALFKPSHFDPEKKYPVLEYTMYAGAENISTPKGAFANNYWTSNWMYSHIVAYAELGFIVVTVDGRGSAWRGKVFRDKSYGWTPNCTGLLEDHVSAITQLAERYPFMDLERVGITGHRGSTQVLYALLEYPDFYKVGVLPEMQDTRLMPAVWGDHYEGAGFRPEEDPRHYSHLLHKFKGKLLIRHGMLDVANPVTGAFRLIAEMEREGKDFDMLIMPNHAAFPSSYLQRRTWDYLVKHLMQEEKNGGQVSY